MKQCAGLGDESLRIARGEQEARDVSLLQKCNLVRKAIAAGKTDWLKKQRWYEQLKSKCTAFEASHAATAAAAGKKGLAMLLAGWEPEVLEAGCQWLEEQQQGEGFEKLEEQAWYESLAMGCSLVGQQQAQPGRPSNTWASNVKEKMQSKKCQLFNYAKNSRVHSLGLKSFGWFKAMGEDCGELALEEGGVAEAAPEDENASSWYKMASDFRKRFSTRHQMKDWTLEKIQGFRAKVLENKCKWFATHATVEEKAWAREQAWYEVLSQKCEQIASLAAEL